MSSRPICITSCVLLLLLLPVPSSSRDFFAACTNKLRVENKSSPLLPFIIYHGMGSCVASAAAGGLVAWQPSALFFPPTSLRILGF